MPPIIDLVVRSCGTETEVDAAPKVIKADGAHIVDLALNFDVEPHDKSDHNIASEKEPKATDPVVPISVCDYKTFTCAPNTNKLGVPCCAATGEVEGIPTSRGEQLLGTKQ